MSDTVIDAIITAGLRGLCARLKINPDRSPAMWGAIGIRLALEQPEFRRLFAQAKKRGRRKGSVRKDKLDLLALEIAKGWSEQAGLPFNEALSEAVKRMQDMGYLLGSDADNPTSHRAVVNRVKRLKEALGR